MGMVRGSRDSTSLVHVASAGGLTYSIWVPSYSHRHPSFRHGRFRQNSTSQAYSDKCAQCEANRWAGHFSRRGALRFVVGAVKVQVQVRVWLLSRL